MMDQVCKVGNILASSVKAEELEVQRGEKKKFTSPTKRQRSCPKSSLVLCREYFINQTSYLQFSHDALSTSNQTSLKGRFARMIFARENVIFP